MSPPPTPRAIELRSLIEQFLGERLTGKLDMLATDDPKREALIAQYRYAAWLEDAARRAGQIQAVTHSLKAIHPDAKGTNLYSPPAALPVRPLVGSHCLDEDFAGDVVGNAAALDVYKFLKLEYEGQSLLSLMLAGDGDLAAALSGDAATAQAWMEAFASITRPRGELASHTRAKQLFWLVGEDPLNDADYQLLAPLYASSLAHRVYQTLQADRFGEEAKEARQARRDKRFHPGVIHDYPNLAIQKLGGTKPQNISQLNSERRGESYLLASLPPHWEQRNVRLPIKTASGSIFPGFSWREEVKALVSALRAFFEDNPEPNVQTRNTRAEFVTRLIDELLVYAAELQSCEPGWSRDPQCNLNRVEQLWLDPRRAAQDETFATEWKRMEWIEDIRKSFANWLNEALRRQLPMGDAEHRQWSRELGGDALWLDMFELDRQWLEQFEREQRELHEDDLDD